MIIVVKKTTTTFSSSTLLFVLKAELNSSGTLFLVPTSRVVFDRKPRRKGHKDGDLVAADRATGFPQGNHPNSLRDVSFRVFSDTTRSDGVAGRLLAGRKLRSSGQEGVLTRELGEGDTCRSLFLIATLEPLKTGKVIVTFHSGQLGEFKENILMKFKS